MNIIFFLILLSSFVHYTYGLFRSRTKYERTLTSSKECCISPKVNIDSKRANLGQDFLRQLTINSDFNPEINTENICNLMHFLFQQASINNKPIVFTQGMFILFDSSNRILDQLITDKKPEPTKNLPPKSDDKYPTYGIDIPNSCLPGNFDHLIFGELPSFSNDKKYNGKRIFLKPDRFGFGKTKFSSSLKDFPSFVIYSVKQGYCRLVKGETKAECAKLRAFKENTDKKILKKWKKVLSKLPSKLNVYKQYNERAIKYGIQEIDQQITNFEIAGAGKYVKDFRKYLINKYGSDDIKVRKGREIIFTITQLKQTHSTCEPHNTIKPC